MFDRLCAGRVARSRSRPRAIIGPGERRLPPGNFQEANAYFQRAAAYPELFYGQLALERLGRSVPRLRPRLPQYTTTPAAAQRLQQPAAGAGDPATRRNSGAPTEQALFVRALAESLDNDADRNLAVELGQQIGRQDLAVWTARMARIKGSMFYVRQAYPTLSASVSGELWSLAHGISRQESSFDPYAVSHAGARGMMQLMTGTAREQAGKMGVGFDSYRLISDPAYNVMIGSAYFQRHAQYLGRQRAARGRELQRRFGQCRQMGPPIWRSARPGRRAQVDRGDPVTSRPRAYVQRVIENSVVYDSMRPAAAAASGDARLALSWEEPARADSRRHGRSPRFITPEGFARIRAEYDELFGIERPKIVETVSWAASLGDRSENADYLYGKQAAARDRPAARRISRGS